jgi:hypothetical protein
MERGVWERFGHTRHVEVGARPRNPFGLGIIGEPVANGSQFDSLSSQGKSA